MWFELKHEVNQAPSLKINPYFNCAVNFLECFSDEEQKIYFLSYFSCIQSYKKCTFKIRFVLKQNKKLYVKL